MKRQNVQSSELRSIGYDPHTRTLEVEFHARGSIYQYYGVPPAIHRRLMHAESHGKYFNKHIRNRNYLYKKVGESELEFALAMPPQGAFSSTPSD
jgi:hypothetical protein